MKALTKTTLSALAFVTLAACNHDRRASDATQTTVRDENGTALEPASRVASARESIVESRCAREQRCDNIGANEDYSSSEDCMARIRNEWKDDLNARECPNGINQDQLQECLTEIRNEDCNSPFDTLGRVAACTVGQICE